MIPASPLKNGSFAARGLTTGSRSCRLAARLAGVATVPLRHQCLVGSTAHLYRGSPRWSLLPVSQCQRWFSDRSRKEGPFPGVLGKPKATSSTPTKEANLSEQARSASAQAVSLKEPTLSSHPLASLRNALSFKGASKLTVRISKRVGGWIVSISRQTVACLAALGNDPRVVKKWSAEAKEAARHFVKWVATGLRLFRRNCGASFALLKKVVKGYRLTLRERNLLARTTADCLKLVPFSLFIVVPFAEFALPVALRIFPNMLPSTFFEGDKGDKNLARKLQAKQEMAGFWQQVVAKRAEETLEAASGDQESKLQALRDFEERLLEDDERPTLKQILRFSRMFKEEFSLEKMSSSQLRAISNILGLRSYLAPRFLELQLRHHVTSLRREDREYLWEGIREVTDDELIAACKKRAIRFHGATKEEMKQDLLRWLHLSSNREISTPLLLWIQSFYLCRSSLVVSPAEERLLAGLHVSTSVAMDSVSDPFEQKPSAAELRKARLDNVEKRLEDVEHEIEEVIIDASGPQEESSHHEGGKVINDSISDIVFDTIDTDHDGVVSREQFRQAHHVKDYEKVKQRVKTLVEELRLDREIIDKQQELLQHQLACLAHMRSNVPSAEKGADRILLDQRVRVLEMISVFEKDTAEIEKLMATSRATSVPH